MKFSNSIEYAIHGLIYLSGAPAGEATQIAGVAKAIKVPEGYLRKVFQQLARAGILSSQRGARGGFYLSGEPENITLKDIVEAIDGSLPSYACLRDRRSCGIALDCPVKLAFMNASQQMAAVLEATTIKGLRDDLQQNRQEAAWMTVGV